MRHAKGTIALSQEQDLPMLRQVLNSQFITHTQLWRFMRNACIELSRASFCWRVTWIRREALGRRREASDGVCLRAVPEGCQHWLRRAITTRSDRAIVDDAVQQSANSRNRI